MVEEEVKELVDVEAINQNAPRGQTVPNGSIALDSSSALEGP